MGKKFEKIIKGYLTFREKYATGESSTMQILADHDQSPELMVIACSDSQCGKHCTSMRY